LLARASKGVIGMLVPKSRAPDAGRASIVGEGTRIAGHIAGDGDVQVDGCVDGNVSGRCVTVGVNGRVAGKIVAKAALVSGSVSGGIAAHTVVLTGTARVACGIVQERLTVEAGAEVAGLLERPDMRVSPPDRVNGEHEMVLIERVVWTRSSAERWVPLSAAGQAD
jgi:cytoskeletal protein CcmA (bactofilin family)